MSAMWLFSYSALFIPSFCIWNRYIGISIYTFMRYCLYLSTFSFLMRHIDGGTLMQNLDMKEERDKLRDIVTYMASNITLLIYEPKLYFSRLIIGQPKNLRPRQQNQRQSRHYILQKTTMMLSKVVCLPYPLGDWRRIRILTIPWATNFSISEAREVLAFARTRSGWVSGRWKLINSVLMWLLRYLFNDFRMVGWNIHIYLHRLCSRQGWHYIF